MADRTWIYASTQTDLERELKAIVHLDAPAIRKRIEKMSPALRLTLAREIVKREEAKRPRKGKAKTWLIARSAADLDAVEKRRATRTRRPVERLEPSGRADSRQPDGRGESDRRRATARLELMGRSVDVGPVSALEVVHRDGSRRLYSHGSDVLDLSEEGRADFEDVTGESGAVFDVGKQEYVRKRRSRAERVSRLQ